MNRYPHWFKKRIVASDQIDATMETLNGLDLETVCGQSLCPNLNECYSRRHATFLILGNACTRRCSFCSTLKGRPARPVDQDEPRRISEAVKRLGMSYVVITSVTRDDMPDGGASHFYNVVAHLKSVLPDIRVEVLVPDFKGNEASIRTVLAAQPDVFAHNIETVERLYAAIRPGARYERSMRVLSSAQGTCQAGAVKSSFMLGLGEDEDEVLTLIDDLAETGCDIISIGQYLRPSKDNIPMDRIVHPEEFDRYKDYALARGIRTVQAGTFIRSSYYAEEAYDSGCAADIG